MRSLIPESIISWEHQNHLSNQEGQVTNLRRILSVAITKRMQVTLPQDLNTNLNQEMKLYKYQRLKTLVL